MKPKIFLLIIFFIFTTEIIAHAKTVHYELTATVGNINLSGKKEVDFALMLNGGIPAPVLEFTEGDDAEIVVKNHIPDDELSIHWHGILLPPEMDGVPYVNTPPIKSGEEFTFRFRIRQHGTFWYHSHTNVQEQKGVYGAFIIHQQKETVAYHKEVVAVLSDWSDENATTILKNLRKDGDYYLYKKGTMRSFLGSLQAKSLGNYLQNEWTRMGGMDLSDVGYDAFLINGKKDSQLIEAHPGEKIRLRIINAAASSYFNISLGQAPMKVISADGVDIEPIFAKEILIGMAETYDVLFEVPDDKNYEFKATAQDGTGAASGWIGRGDKVPAPVKPLPDMYATMGHGGHSGHASPVHTQNGQANHQKNSGTQNGHMMPAVDSPENKTPSMGSNQNGHTGHNGMSMPNKDSTGSSEKTVETLTVDGIRAAKQTAFPKNAQTYELKLVLSGDMRRYIWHINGKTIQQDRTIEIKEGDVVRFIFENQTMMHHPMHLHGHFFRVLNDNGDYSPLKHTVDVPPHMTRTIEFLANEPGEWMLHCHNLYHLKTGMARVVKYMSFTPKPDILQLQHQDPHLHDHLYYYGKAEASSNHAELNLRLSQTWQQIETRLETANIAGKNFSFKNKWDFEGDLFYRRWFSRYLNIVGGGIRYGNETSAVVGFGYTLPFLIESNIFVSQRGKFRIDLERRFQWTKSIFSDVNFTWRPSQQGAHEAEYEVSLMYSPAWAWAGGLMLTNDSIGGGLECQF